MIYFQRKKRKSSKGASINEVTDLVGEGVKDFVTTLYHKLYDDGKGKC